MEWNEIKKKGITIKHFYFKNNLKDFKKKKKNRKQTKERK
jgi:hypothetical protein